MRVRCRAARRGSERARGRNPRFSPSRVLLRRIARVVWELSVPRGSDDDAVSGRWRERSRACHGREIEGLIERASLRADYPCRSTR